MYKHIYFIFRNVIINFTSHVISFDRSILLGRSDSWVQVFRMSCICKINFGPLTPVSGSGMSSESSIWCKIESIRISLHFSGQKNEFFGLFELKWNELKLFKKTHIHTIFLNRYILSTIHIETSGTQLTSFLFMLNASHPFGTHKT